MIFLKNKIKLASTLILIIVIIFVYVFIKGYYQKNLFKNERDKNRIERCVSREKNKCNSNRKVCKLYDKRNNKECQNEFDECIKKSTLECESKNQ